MSERQLLGQPGRFSEGSELGHTLVWLVHGAAEQTVSVEESATCSPALEAAGDDVHLTELPGIDHPAWDPGYQSPDIAAWLFAQQRR